jgi:hypothetical protein
MLDFPQLGRYQAFSGSSSKSLSLVGIFIMSKVGIPLNANDFLGPVRFAKVLPNPYEWGALHKSKTLLKVHKIALP